MRSSSFSPLSSKRHNSTFVACAENKAKLTPSPSQVAPKGNGEPSAMRISCAMYAGVQMLGASIDVMMGASACMRRERWPGMGRRVFASSVQRHPRPTGRTKSRFRAHRRASISDSFWLLALSGMVPILQLRRSGKLAVCTLGHGGLYEIAVGAHRVDLLP